MESPDPQSEPQTAQDYRALRISQLDASELDSELFQLLRGQIKNVLKYLHPSILASVGPEINAALRYIMWMFSLRIGESTIGQSLLDVRYKDETAKGAQWISHKQKIGFLLCQVLGPWLQERAPDLAVWTRNYPRLAFLWTLLSRSEKVWKVATLFNFLLFLRQGKYQFVIERLLGIRAVFPRPMGMRQMSYEYMDREMLWHGFAEFLFFVLPLINFRKIRNYIRRQLLPAAVEGGRADRTSSDYRECAVCGESPVNVHDMGCRHVFCYSCLMGNVTADSAYSCPQCGQVVNGLDGVKPVMVELKASQPEKAE